MGRSIDPRSCVPGCSQVDLPLLHAAETAEEGGILQRGGAGRPAARMEGQASFVLPVTRSTRARVFQVAAQPRNPQMPNSELETGPEVFVTKHPRRDSVGGHHPAQSAPQGAPTRTG